MTRLRTSVLTNDNYNIFKRTHTHTHTHTQPTLGTSPVITFLSAHTHTQKTYSWDFPGDPVAKLCVPNAGGLGSIPSGEARSQRSQLGVLMLQLKIPHAATKT